MLPEPPLETQTLEAASMAMPEGSLRLALVKPEEPESGAPRLLYSSTALLPSAAQMLPCASMAML